MSICIDDLLHTIMDHFDMVYYNLTLLCKNDMSSQNFNYHSDNNVDKEVSVFFSIDMVCER